MKQVWWMVLGLMVVALPWLPGLSYPFVYDDAGMIAENEFLAEGGNVWRVLRGDTLGDAEVVNGRRPVVLASYFMDRAWAGLRPRGWRVSSLVAHLGCAFLLWGLLCRLGATGWVAVAAMGLFGLHPAVSEAVHSPGFRADVLCLLWMLVAVHAALWAEAGGWRRRVGWTGLVAGSALALLSKETAMALPLLLGLLAWLRPQAFGLRARGRWALAGVGAAVSAAFFTMWLVLPVGLQAAGGSWNGMSLEVPQNVWSMPAVWWRTWRYLVIPWRLSVAPLFVPVMSLGSPRLWSGLALAVLLGGVFWGARRRNPWVSLGIGWVAVMFAPVSNAWPLLHPVADRFLYPMAAGFGLAVAGALGALRGRWWRNGAAVLWVAGYAVLLSVRLAEWRTPEALWESAYRLESRSAITATWLGLLREEAGDVEGARRLYREAVELNPWESAAWVNGGVLEGKLGDLEEAERWLRRAVEVKPEGKNGWHNLEVCLALKREREAAAVEAAETAAGVEAEAEADAGDAD